MALAKDPDAALADALAALASPTRLVLLRNLRTPKTLREIDIRVGAPGDERPIARQTVKEHLDKLVQAGMVLAHEASRDYGPTTEYVVNHQAVFALTEETRGLARLRPATEPSGATAQSPVAESPPITGPCLLLVKGLDEGTSFDLTPPPAGNAKWVIGRRRGIAVPLDFDPFASGENTIVVWEDGAHLIEDLPESRNGTTVNFRTLPKGARRVLRHGDLIGVGRTILEFRL